ncbi:hypothetical protein FA95DRAFT_1280337 [Auriscalpium vulgare]|uniref:Uncharacterized protein n=1 Tax=Auriscalpium vulgare TaxID=40419 RepID=A0ACB8R2X4_9AGAM|nr:hypothetical protein FA95DRAFT_1280337 [Auriscalpium vulgare]
MNLSRSAMAMYSAGPQCPYPMSRLPSRRIRADDVASAPEQQTAPREAAEGDLFTGHATCRWWQPRSTGHATATTPQLSCWCRASCMGPTARPASRCVLPSQSLLSRERIRSAYIYRLVHLNDMAFNFTEYRR